jgi:hypothetical protein
MRAGPEPVLLVQVALSVPDEPKPAYIEVAGPEIVTAAGQIVLKAVGLHVLEKRCVQSRSSHLHQLQYNDAHSPLR